MFLPVIPRATSFSSSFLPSYRFSLVRWCGLSSNLTEIQFPFGPQDGYKFSTQSYLTALKIYFMCECCNFSLLHFPILVSDLQSIFMVQQFFMFHFSSALSYSCFMACFHIFHLLTEWLTSLAGLLCGCSFFGEFPWFACHVSFQELWTSFGRRNARQTATSEGSHCASHLISVAKMNKKTHKLCHLIAMGTIRLKVCFKVRH